MKTNYYKFLFQRGDVARKCCNGSSAELHSAVSRICNPRIASRPYDAAKHGVLPNAIRRYSRLKICATAAAPGEKYFATLRFSAFSAPLRFVFGAFLFAATAHAKLN